MLNHDHTFDWNNIKILDTKSNYNKKLILEMLHIKKQVNGINSQKDTEFLDESYSCLLNNLSNYNLRHL